MLTLQERLETATTQVETDSGLLHDIVHGDAATEVATEGGNVKSAAKAIADLEATYEAASVVATVTTLRDESQAYSDQAHAWAEEPEDTEVAPGQYSALHHAAKAQQAAASLVFAGHGLTRNGAALEWSHGDDPFDASAPDEWAVLPGNAVFSINANGHLEVTF